MKVFPTNLTTDTQDIIKLQLLSLLLFKGQASPFYKNLIETHYAKTFSPLQGYLTFSKNSCFVIGACEIDSSLSEKEFDDIITKTLNQVLTEGFDERRIQGILNEVQFSYKQIKSRLFFEVSLNNRIWFNPNAIDDRILDSSCRSIILSAIRSTIRSYFKRRC